MGITAELESLETHDYCNCFRTLMLNDPGNIDKGLKHILQSTSIMTITKLLITIVRDMVGFSNITPGMLNKLKQTDGIDLVFSKYNDPDWFYIRRLWYDPTWEALPKKNISYKEVILPTVVGIHELYCFSLEKISIESGTRIDQTSLVKLEKIRSHATRNQFNLSSENMLLLDHLFIPVTDAKDLNTLNTLSFFVLVYLLLNNLYKELPEVAGMISSILYDVFE